LSFNRSQWSFLFETEFYEENKRLFPLAPVGFAGIAGIIDHMIPYTHNTRIPV